MVGEVEMVPLMPVLNVHILDGTITTRILLIQSKVYHKSVNKKLTDYLSCSDNQKKSEAILCADNRKNGLLKVG